MNKYVRASYCVPCGILKMLILKITKFSTFIGPKLCIVSPLSEITLDKGGKLEIGTNFKMRDGSKIRVRKGAICKIGRNVSINSNNIITCREKIIIGDDVQFAPNVQIYDHDHDYRIEGGIKTGKYRSSSIIIGNNVWIGANTVILRGTIIGDNCVIGAGTIVKGKISKDTLIYQKRNTNIKKIKI